MSKADLPAVFAALGDPTRLALLGRLSDGAEASIQALAAETALSRQAVTKHLGVLARAGLVSAARAGRETRFRYRPDAVIAARDHLAGVGAQWEAALDRLRAFVEG